MGWTPPFVCAKLAHWSSLAWGSGLRRDRFGRGRQARFLVGLDVDLTVDHPAAELQELGADPDAAPVLQGGFADTPAGSELFLVEVSDVHLGLLPNELAGVHEGAVLPTSQGITRPGA